MHKGTFYLTLNGLYNGYSTMYVCHSSKCEYVGALSLDELFMAISGLFVSTDCSIGIF